jgi:hypothetical protein
MHGDYRSALDAAEKRGKSEVIEFLIKNGARRTESLQSGVKDIGTDDAENTDDVGDNERGASHSDLRDI